MRIKRHLQNTYVYIHVYIYTYTCMYTIQTFHQTDKCGTCSGSPTLFNHFIEETDTFVCLLYKMAE